MLSRHPAKVRASLVIIFNDGERQRFSASAVEENMGVNALRARALRKGDVEDAPGTVSLRRPYQPDGSCQAQGEGNKVTVEPVAVGKRAR